MLVSWVNTWSKGGIPHRRTFRNFAHRTWAIWDFTNHALFRMISDPGSQQRVTVLLLQSISTIPFLARASDVKMPRLRQHSSNHRMPCFIYVFGTFWGTWDQADENPGTHFMCTADIFSNVTYHEIQRPGILIARKFCHVSLVGCTNDRHNCRFGSKLILSIPLRNSCVQLAVDSTTLRLCEAHWLEIGVCLKRKMF